MQKFVLFKKSFMNCKIPLCLVLSRTINILRSLQQQKITFWDAAENFTMVHKFMYTAPSSGHQLLNPQTVL